ncbi:MAG: PilN domain-containing protein [Pseudomonadota bacterium]
MSGISVIHSVRAFLRWWREELVSLLPGELRNHLQHREHQLVVCFSEDGVQLTDCRLGQPESSVDFVLDAQGAVSQTDKERLSRLRGRGGDKVVIRLPHEHVLSLSFPLPLEAEKNLLEVLGYELGRHAPFKIEQVYFDYAVLERRSDENKIWVSVMVVPRNQVEPLITMVRAWGLIPEVLTVSEQSESQGEQCALSGFNLLPLAERDRAKGSMNMAAKVLVLSASLLMATLASYPLLLQEMRISELRAQVEAVRNEAVNVQSMQQELERVAAESAFVDEKKRQFPEVLDVLNALTEILPDDTWLERFEMKVTRIRMQGFSADASSLIELLENSPLLQNAAFDSPVVKDPKTDRFRFQIVAELTGEGG